MEASISLITSERGTFDGAKKSAWKAAE